MLAIMGCTNSKMTMAVVESGQGSVSNSIRSEFESTPPFPPVSISVPDSLASEHQAVDGVSELDALSAFPSMALSENPASHSCNDISYVPGNNNRSAFHSEISFQSEAIIPKSGFQSDKACGGAEKERIDTDDDTKNEEINALSRRPQDKSSMIPEEARSSEMKNAMGSNVNAIPLAVLEPILGGKELSSTSSIYSISIPSRKAAMVASHETTEPVFFSNSGETKDSSGLLASSSAYLEPVPSATEEGVPSDTDDSSRGEERGDTKTNSERFKYCCWALLAITSGLFGVARKRNHKFKSMVKSINLDVPFTCAILTFITHSSNIFSGEFVWDDRAAILDNPDVLGHRSIGQLFFHDFWGQQMSSSDSHKSFRPLAVLSFRISRIVYGLNARGFHFDNVFLHALVVYFYSKFCFRLTETYMAKDRKQAWSVATVASVVYSVHPVHVEPVCSIVGRSDVLCGLFFIVGLSCYTSSTMKIEALGFALGVLSTMSKEIGVTVYAIFAANDLIKMAAVSDSGKYRRLKFSWTSQLTKFVVAFVFAISLTAVHISLHGDNILHNFTILENSIYLIPKRSYRILSYLNIDTLYLLKLMFPFRLSYDYGWPCIPHVESIFDVRNLGSALSVGLLLAFGVSSIRNKNGLLMWSLALLVVPFVPASNLLFPVGTELAERLLYIPSMGYCIFVGYLMGRCKNFPVKQLVFVIVIAGMIWKCISRSHEWKNEALLLTSALGVCPTSLKVLNNYGQMFVKSDPIHAIPYLEKATTIHENYASAHFNIGVAHKVSGDFLAAMNSFEKVVELRPSDSQTKFILAESMYLHAKKIVYSDVETSRRYMFEANSLLDKLVHSKRPQALQLRCEIMSNVVGFSNVAESICLEAIRICNDYKSKNEANITLDTTMNTLGLISSQAGRKDDAVKYFLEGLEENPKNFNLLLNLGAVYVEKRQFHLAKATYDKAEALHVTSPDMKAFLYANRGWLLENLNQKIEAKEFYHLAIALQSNPHPQIVTNLRNIEEFCKNNTCR